MRVSDLHPTLRATAEPVPGRGGVFAVVPVLLPQSVDISGCEALFTQARFEHDQLQAELGQYPHVGLLLRMLNRREAVDSSQIEGTSTGYDDLELYEIDRHTESEAVNDSEVTLAYVTAFHWGLQEVETRGREGLTLDLITGIHARLMDSQPDATPGVIRDRQNFIGRNFTDARYVPPPVAMLPGLLENLQRFLQWDFDDREPSIFLRTAVAHVQFEAIHPFLDGNGRVGRLLLPLMFAAEHEVPIHLASFLKLRRDDYYAALLDVQMRLNWQPWLTLYLECVIASCRHTRQLVQNCMRLRAEWASNIRVRSDSVVPRILDRLLGSPYVTVNDLAEQLNVSFPAANNAIQRLVEHGVLRPVSQQRRNRVFFAHQVTNLLMTGLDSALQAAQERPGW